MTPVGLLICLTFCCATLTSALICPKDEVPGCSGCEDNCNQLIADQNKALCNRKKECRKNCVCKPGLIREADGKCVHPVKCPKQDQTCPLNEHLDQCGHKCENQCNQPKHSRFCKDTVCRGSTFECTCDFGFVRHPNLTCVPERQCPVDIYKQHKVCPVNEHYNHCGNQCEIYCESDSQTCPRHCRGPGACVCNKGFERAPRGDCVPSDQCSATPPPGPSPNTTTVSTTTTTKEPHTTTTPPHPPCGKHEYWDVCGNKCEGKCDDPEHQRICMDNCKAPACACDKNYFRNPEGECVLKSQCPEAPTSTTTSATTESPSSTTESTTSTATHPTCFGEHEVWDEEGCEETCFGDYLYDRHCSHEAKCVCEPGYSRSVDDICVPSDECPTTTTSTSTTPEPSTTTPSCAYHEHWDNDGCEDVCVGQNATKHDCTYDGKCVCDDGYALDKEFYECVPRYECTGNNVTTTTRSTTESPTTQPCPEHEVWDEEGCEEKCEDDYWYNPYPDPKCSYVAQCVCEPGYARDQIGACVLSDECSATTTSTTTTTEPSTTTSPCFGAHQHWSKVGCESHCIASGGTEYSCSEVDQCVCDSGYARDEFNNCVPPAECTGPPPTTTESTTRATTTEPCSEHEIWDDTGCDKLCDGRINCTYTARCVCENGYVRNEDGICVLSYECPLTTTSTEPSPTTQTTTGPTTVTDVCSANEIWDDNGCDDLCDGSTNCTYTGRCVCEHDYVRNEAGICVLPYECPIATTSTEPSTTTHTTPPKPRYHFCKERLCCEWNCDGEYVCSKAHRDVCNYRYARNSSIDECVLIKECSGPQNRTGCEKHCNKPGCVDHVEPAWICPEGQERHSNGLCVWPKYCPHTNTSTTESPSTTTEFPTTSETTSATTTNPKPSYHFCEERLCCEWNCDGAYICSKAHRDVCDYRYARNSSIDECVLIKECSGPEYRPGCEKHCNKPGCVDHVYPAWICPEGQERHSNGLCVWPKYCPHVNTTTTESPSTTTEPPTTSETTIPITTTGVCYGEHEIWDTTGCDEACDGKINCTETGRCVCDYKYVRNEDGICVRSNQCPRTTTSTEPPTTTQTTTNPITTTVDPEHYCYEGLCCEWNCDGTYLCSRESRYICDHYRHARNSSTGECVLITECSGPVNRTGCEKHCNVPGCVAFPHPALICPDGQERHSNGLCVWPKYCPHVNTTTTEPPTTSETTSPMTTTGSCYGEHEMWDIRGCEIACGGDHICTQTPRCVCEYNYARDKYDYCIPEKDCPWPSTTTESPTTTAPISTTTGACPANEVWDKDGCDEKCNTGINCTFVPQCVCDVGYARDASGHCIERGNCSLKTCKKNERWDEYGCEDTCSEPSYHCTEHARCVCDYGYRRDGDGECVPEGECGNITTSTSTSTTTHTVAPPVCKEVYRPGCEATCDNHSCHGFHIRTCQKGCYRNPAGECVDLNQCEAETTTSSVPTTTATPHDDNCHIEPFGGCETACNGAKNCSWISNVCLCDEGYYRAEDGLCVLREQCLNHTIPPQNGTNCTFDDSSVPHCEYDCYGHRYCTARPGCFCDPGYVRADDKICVLHEQCENHTTPDPFATTTTAPVPTTSDPHCEFSIVGECEFDCYGHRHCYSTSGCYCRQGYVRAEDNLCVTHDACHNHTTASSTTSTTPSTSSPPRPRKNETGILPTGCETWCDGYHYCSSNESFCKEGYRRNEYGDDPEHFCDEGLCCEWNCDGTYPCSRDPHYICDHYRHARNSSTGECVPIKECSGPQNRTGCEKHCNKPGCVDHVDPAWICPEGQERHSNGLCVWPKYCPHVNTTTTESPSTTTEPPTTSETTRPTPQPRYHFCEERLCCEWNCDGAYICSKAHRDVCDYRYARNSSIDECVLIKECSGPEYRPGCEKHCNKPGCVDHVEPAWICPDGQERHSNGLCVWPKYCPHVNTTTTESPSTTTEPPTTSETTSATTSGHNDTGRHEHKRYGCENICGSYACVPHLPPNPLVSICDEGYYRDKGNNLCVLHKDCHSTPTTSSPGHSTTTPSTIEPTSITTEPPTTSATSESPTSESTPVTTTSNPITPGPNEVCDDFGCEFLCHNDTPVCKNIHWCHCQGDYYRAEDGVCVKKSQCDDHTTTTGTATTPSTTTGGTTVSTPTTGITTSESTPPDTTTAPSTKPTTTETTTSPSSATEPATTATDTTATESTTTTSSATTSPGNHERYRYGCEKICSDPYDCIPHLPGTTRALEVKICDETYYRRQDGKCVKQEECDDVGGSTTPAPATSAQPSSQSTREGSTTEAAITPHPSSQSTLTSSGPSNSTETEPPTTTKPTSSEPSNSTDPEPLTTSKRNCTQENEEWSCAGELSCSDPYLIDGHNTFKCKETDPYKCYCKQNFARHRTGECVHPLKCREA